MKILVLPDVQAKPGNSFDFLYRIGTYMVEKKPDVVVCIGDFCDYPSLSSFDVGKKSFEGKRYTKDVEASLEAMAAFLNPLQEFNARAKRLKEKQYHPRLVMCLGNHEHRVTRATEDDPKLDGLISVRDLKYEEFGWEVHDFLKVVVIEGVAFSHYFVTGTMGRPASTAAAQLRVTSMSCFSGHQQGKQIAYGKRADGAILTSILSGSCYEHDETYLSPQMNVQHWRGFFMLHEVCNGAFDEMPVSLGYINKKYAHLSLPKDTAKEPVGAGEV